MIRSRGQGPAHGPGGMLLALQEHGRDWMPIKHSLVFQLTISADFYEESHVTFARIETRVLPTLSSPRKPFHSSAWIRPCPCKKSADIRPRRARRLCMFQRINKKRHWRPEKFSKQYARSYFSTFMISTSSPGRRNCSRYLSGSSNCRLPAARYVSSFSALGELSKWPSGVSTSQSLPWSNE